MRPSLSGDHPAAAPVKECHVLVNETARRALRRSAFFINETARRAGREFSDAREIAAISRRNNFESGNEQSVGFLSCAPFETAQCAEAVPLQWS